MWAWARLTAVPVMTTWQSGLRPRTTRSPSRETCVWLDPRMTLSVAMTAPRTGPRGNPAARADTVPGENAGAINLANSTAPVGAFQESRRKTSIGGESRRRPASAKPQAVVGGGSYYLFENRMMRGKARHRGEATPE